MPRRGYPFMAMLCKQMLVDVDLRQTLDQFSGRSFIRKPLMTTPIKGKYHISGKGELKITDRGLPLRGRCVCLQFFYIAVAPTGHRGVPIYVIYSYSIKQ